LGVQDLQEFKPETYTTTLNVELMQHTSCAHKNDSGVQTRNKYNYTFQV
jgi:hypothetical protein